MFYINNEITTNDKFDLAKFIEMDENGVFDSINSYVLFTLPTSPRSGSYVIGAEAYRPDYIAYTVYGDTQYWWIIMWYNHCFNPLDLKEGLEISYPSLSALNQLYLQASLNTKVS